MNEYGRYDAVGLAELVHSEEVTAAELLDAARARADAVNPRVNAIVRFLEPKGVGSPHPTPAPFAGVPFLLKDLFHDMAGEITSVGSRSMANVRAPQTTTVVQRWLDAGLQVFGKTNTPEFGAKAVTEPELFGPARNPWNLDHTPGGSSGGAAAAVAAGIVPCAAASDGGGSIRIPAACCGLFGLKAGRGLIPAGPIVGEALLGSSLHGVISRSVRDTAAMLDVLAGGAPESPYAPAPPDRPFAEEVGADSTPPTRLRIGAVAVTGADEREAMAGAVAALEGLGHDVDQVPAPYEHKALAKDFLTAWFVNAAHLVDRIKAATGSGDEGFELDTLIMAAIGRAHTSLELFGALDRRQEHLLRLAAFHETYDLLLTPTLAAAPPPIGAFDTPAPLRRAGELLLRARAARLLTPLGVVDKMIDDNLGWVPYTQLANFTGRPAMSVPLHWTPAGLPLGVQFVAPLRGEALLLRLAAQLEAAHPWADRRPQL